jgi:PTS system ascorbate-specific IIA component
MNRILLITHDHVGDALLAIAKHTLAGRLPCTGDAVNIHQNSADAEFVRDRLLDCLSHHEENVLILTDLLGATPCNIAKYIATHRENTRIVTGLNLSMLLRALNYADDPLETMAEKAYTGGRDGVSLCAAFEDEKPS